MLLSETRLDMLFIDMVSGFVNMSGRQLLLSLDCAVAPSVSDGCSGVAGAALQVQAHRAL